MHVRGGGKKRLKQRAADFCWMRSGLSASVDVIEFKATEAYTSLDQTRVTGRIFTLFCASWRPVRRLLRGAYEFADESACLTADYVRNEIVTIH
jgi:hypothetical protein